MEGVAGERVGGGVKMGSEQNLMNVTVPPTVVVTLINLTLSMSIFITWNELTPKIGTLIAFFASVISATLIDNHHRGCFSNVQKTDLGDVFAACIRELLSSSGSPPSPIPGPARLHLLLGAPREGSPAFSVPGFFVSKIRGMLHFFWLNPPSTDPSRNRQD
jgi:hypothetical protein